MILTTVHSLKKLALIFFIGYAQQSWTIQFAEFSGRKGRIPGHHYVQDAYVVGSPKEDHDDEQHTQIPWPDGGVCPVASILDLGFIGERTRHQATRRRANDKVAKAQLRLMRAQCMTKFVATNPEGRWSRGYEM